MTHIFKYGDKNLLALVSSNKDEDILDITYLTDCGKEELFKLSPMFKDSLLVPLKNCISMPVVYRNILGNVVFENVYCRDRFEYVLQSGERVRIDKCQSLEDYQKSCHVGDNVGIRLSAPKQKLVSSNGAIIAETDRYICAVELQDDFKVRIAYIPRCDIVPPDNYQHLFEEKCKELDLDPKIIMTGIETKETMEKTQKWKNRRQITLHKFLPERAAIKKQKIRTVEDGLRSRTDSEQRFHLFFSFLFLMTTTSFYYFKYFHKKTVEESGTECPNECLFNYNC